MRRVVSVILLCIFSIIIFSGCGVLRDLGLDESEDELRPVSSIVMGDEEAEAVSGKVPVYLYFANEDNTKLKLEVRYISAEAAKKDVGQMAGVVIEELIKGPTDTETYKATIPEGSKLRSPVVIKDGIATVDMSGEFKTRHPGGKDAEKLTIYSIVNSLTELKGIKKVKFTIDGKVLKEYMGNFKFDNPFPRSTGVISKEVPDKKSKPDLKKDEKKNGKGIGPIEGETIGEGGSGDGAEETFEGQEELEPLE
jgi:germination protein M